ncbi:Oidioi.mRNA.OKI2018_I69.PAR.g11429.t1.cds [Oikopleura dioica]|uniref:Oidioi.mRNA.OKI2018_I69.PAR.g11429.t1.cds n=1 Tax=Oikopleura dioica TaxID=34765 RepID=A0ABN7S2U4_OIKDI|nr:Oidioi.mRNA.OKI2018_I69.PAR.g11429.t1.cds [Oikopleura dioica]
MSSNDETSVPYESAVLDINTTDLANDLFNSDITIWLTYALEELSKFEQWLKEKGLDTPKNLAFLAKLQNRTVEESYDSVDIVNKSQQRKISECLSLGGALLPDDQCHAEFSYQKAIEAGEELDEEIKEMLKKLLAEKSKAARLKGFDVAFDEAIADVDRVLANATSTMSLKN